jgi:LacI family transcriptional regulator
VRLPDWASGFSHRLFAGLAEFQRRKGYFQLHFDQPSGGDLPTVRIDKHWRGDGLLVYRYTADEAVAWSQQGIRVVNLSCEQPRQGAGFPRVTIDNELAGKMAAAHLASLGLRDFAYVHESAREYSAERLNGFEEGVRMVGGKLHVVNVPASSYPLASRSARIERTMVRQIRELPMPCGIFAKDDIAAVWTIKVLDKLGVNCPNRAAVLGIDDDVVFCHATDPPLSSIRYPGEEIGFAAAELLHRMMTGERPPPDTRIRIRPGPVAVRESTGQVILSDPVMVKALMFIRHESPLRAVTVNETAGAAGVSREMLRLKFQQFLGRTPKEESDRVRMGILTERMRDPAKTLDQIAWDSGFAGSGELNRFFQRMSGIAPGRFRKQGKG